MVVNETKVEEFFKVLENAFCVKCDHYDASIGGIIDQDCCDLEPFDDCMILYLTGVDFPKANICEKGDQHE